MTGVSRIPYNRDMHRPSSIVLLSGGLDSVAALYWATKESDIVMALTFDYGQKASLREIEVSQSICNSLDVKHKVIKLDVFNYIKTGALLNSMSGIPDPHVADLDDKVASHNSAQAVWVPNRNGVFLNIAAALAEGFLANWVVVGFNSEEAATFPDNSIDFVKACDKFFEFSTQGRVTVQAPHADKTKTEIVKWGVDRKMDFSKIWSCYRGGDKMCGTCESCLRLNRALKAGGAAKFAKELF